MVIQWKNCPPFWNILYELKPFHIIASSFSVRYVRALIYCTYVCSTVISNQLNQSWRIATLFCSRINQILWSITKVYTTLIFNIICIASVVQKPIPTRIRIKQYYCFITIIEAVDNQEMYWTVYAHTYSYSNALFLFPDNRKAPGDIRNPYERDSNPLLIGFENSNNFFLKNAAKILSSRT